jgi:multiple sugar transport system permease protein
VLTYIWKNTGCDMMLWLAGLDGIPKELFEAAKVDGAGSWQSFFHVALPGLKSTAFLVLVLSVVNSFKVFREAYLISGDYPHETISLSYPSIKSITCSTIGLYPWTYRR